MALIPLSRFAKESRLPCTAIVAILINKLAKVECRDGEVLIDPATLEVAKLRQSEFSDSDRAVLREIAEELVADTWNHFTDLLKNSASLPNLSGVARGKDK